MPAIEAKTQRELDKIIRTFRSLTKTFDKKGQQKLLRKGAHVIKSAIRELSPESDETHYRYQTAKLDKSKRAAKGSGQVVASYDPGNFKRAVQVMAFRNSPALFVGPKVAKSKAGGQFSGNKVDGYYGHIVEHGNIHYGGSAPIRRGYSGSKAAAIKVIELTGRKMISDFKNKHKI